MTRYLIYDPGLRLTQRGRRFIIAAALALSIAAGCATGARGATCVPVTNSPGVVTTAERFTGGLLPRYMVTVKARVGRATFLTMRRYAVGQAVVVSGCVDAQGQIGRPRVR